MKRKFLKVGVLLFISALSYGCSHGNSKNDNKAPSNDSTAVEQTWQINDYKDDFGEPTGEQYVSIGTIGTFSNSATTNSRLAVIVSPYKYETHKGDTLGSVAIYLSEYGRNMVRGASVFNVDVKGNNGHVVHAIAFNDDYGRTQIKGYSTGLEPDSIFNMLMAGGKVMFVMRSSKAPISTYKFTIENANGLQQAFEKAKTKVQPYPYKNL